MKKRYKFWFGAVAALVVLIALLLVTQLLRMDVNAFAERFKDSLWAIPVVVILYLLKAVTLVILPQPLVYLITGLLFSPLIAFLVTVGGLSLEFTMDYFLGRRFGSRFLLPLLDRLRGRSRTLDRVLSSDTLDNFGTIALLRLMPGLATDPVSFIAGAQRVRFRQFFLASMVGCAPQAIAVTLMGSAVHDPLSPQFLIPTGALVAVLVVTMIVQRKFRNKEKAKKRRRSKPMQLTFLGTCAADADREAIQTVCPDRFDPDHRRYAAALLDGHILIDCGPTVPEAMRILGADPQAVTDLIITHTHEDHFDPASLEAVVGNRQDPLRIWCELNACARVSGVPGTLLCPLIAGQPVQLDTLTLTPLAANHRVEETPETPLHYLIEEGGRRLFYGCDGGWLLTATLEALIGKRIDLFVFDGTVGDYEGDERLAAHNSIPMIRLMLKSMRPLGVFAPNGRIYLSHLARTLHRPHAETQEILARDGLYAAFDGLTLDI